MWSTSGTKSSRRSGSPPMNTKLEAPERDALVDGVPPLVRRQLVRVPQGVPVVAVTAGTSAPVGDVQVDLAQALQRLTAPQRAALETLEQRDIVRVVHVDPEGKLDEVETARPCRALRVGEQRRRAHGGRGEQADDGLRQCLAPHASGRVPPGSSRRRRPDRRRDAGRPSARRPLEILERDRRAVAVDHDDCLGAGVERVGEHGGETLAEGLAALREALPAARPADESGQWRAAVAASRDGRAASASAITSVTPSSRSACVRVPREQSSVQGERRVVADGLRETRLHGASHQRPGHHDQHAGSGVETQVWRIGSRVPFGRRSRATSMRHGPKADNWAPRSHGPQPGRTGRSRACRHGGNADGHANGKASGSGASKTGDDRQPQAGGQGEGQRREPVPGVDDRQAEREQGQASRRRPAP